MGWGTGNIGGGSGGLNFKVVGGTSEPTSPKENTIWVNTGEKITSWVLSATEPATPAEGMVWIATGATSSVAFNALKKNGIFVYPNSVKQYVDGAWVDVTSMSYQGGEWKEWLLYLYKEGNECTDITGGWVAKAWRLNSNFTAKVPTLKKQSNRMNIVYSSSDTNTSGAICVEEDVDVTLHKTLYIDYDTENSEYNSGFVSVYVLDRDSTYLNNSVAQMQLKNQAARRTDSLDISNISGSFAIVISPRITSVAGYTQNFNIYNVWLG